MQTTILRVRETGHHVRIEHDKVNKQDGCGVLISSNPIVRAQVEADAKKFREITDLKGKGII